MLKLIKFYLTDHQETKIFFEKIDKFKWDYGVSIVINSFYSYFNPIMLSH
jgi:hypothetical protein